MNPPPSSRIAPHFVYSSYVNVVPTIQPCAPSDLTFGNNRCADGVCLRMPHARIRTDAFRILSSSSHNMEPPNFIIHPLDLLSHMDPYVYMYSLAARSDTGRIVSSRRSSTSCRASKSANSSPSSTTVCVPCFDLDQISDKQLSDALCPICMNSFAAVIAEEELAHAMDSPAVAADTLGVTRLHKTCGHVFCRKECVLLLALCDAHPHVDPCATQSLNVDSHGTYNLPNMPYPDPLPSSLTLNRRNSRHPARRSTHFRRHPRRRRRPPRIPHRRTYSRRRRRRLCTSD